MPLTTTTTTAHNENPMIEKENEHQSAQRLGWAEPAYFICYGNEVDLASLVNRDKIGI